MSHRRVIIEYCGNYQYRHSLIHISVIISLCCFNLNFSFKFGLYWFLINSSCIDRQLLATTSTLRRMIVCLKKRVIHRCIVFFYIFFRFLVLLLFCFCFFGFFLVLMFGVQAEKEIIEPSSTAVIEMAATTVANTFLSILY